MTTQNNETCGCANTKCCCDSSKGERCSCGDNCRCRAQCRCGGGCSCPCAKAK